MFGNAGLAVEELPAGDLDGGDVLKIGSTAYVGMGGRTNAAGVEALASVIGPRGWDVRPILVTKVLHLKSAVTALPDGTVIGYPPLIDDQTLFPGFFEVPEEHGGHVVLVADDTVLMSTSAPRTAEMLQARGLTTVCVDISEFERLEGCVTCLSVRVRQLASSRGTRRSACFAHDSSYGDEPRRDNGGDGFRLWRHVHRAR